MRDPREISRSDAAAMGAEALKVCRAGSYTAPSGRVVELRDAIARAVAGTVDIPPEQLLEPAPRHETSSRIEVCEGSTLAVARRLHDAGLDVVALNFASARHPGGGFLSGARAQEESLCRASALYVCLEGQPMYTRRESWQDGLNSDSIVHSPAVPVFRGDAGALLEQPWSCGFITAAAPNRNTLRAHAPAREPELPQVFARRISRVLAVAARGGHTAVVLGAWGCGAFGCDPEVVAEQFFKGLTGPFRGAFAHVAFAILDTSPERRTIGPFERRFAGLA
ncbi:TIGR02452 family protein [Nannocystis radixulma]|uniref:TIGR02452 family protein n=1 Tax=Nannocystis radixulma TaxID=2995305 RepID=A0ABT5B8W5_9BACT|nr:TIGR02452 family protein [Nannocystis radixulma]MDC0670143.1 TIGR02452 family protein [Nannocystis radixulma]